MGSERVFLTAEWRDLAMLNYQVDPGLLHKLVPDGTELDSWQGKTFVSLVGFRFLKTRVFGVVIPFHRHFDEVNLRFYVTRREGGEIRRGVVFIKEIVPRRMIASVARTVYNENYEALPMAHQVRSSDAGAAVEYAWRPEGGWSRLTLTASGNLALPEQGSEQQFITEHYWGYAAQRNGGCLEYRVAHEPWRVWSGADARLDGDHEGLYGRDLAAVLKTSPSSAYLTEGSAVTVFRGRRLA